MPIDLDARCADRLREGLPKALSAVKVQNNTSIPFESLSKVRELEKVLPERGSTRDALERSVGDYPLLTFVAHWMHANVLRNKPFDENAPPVALCQWDPALDLHEVAASIVGDLQSLPWHYRFRFRLPSRAALQLVSGFDETYEFAPTVRIVGEPPAAGMLAGGLGGLGGQPELGPPQPSYYVSVETDGFLWENGEGPPFEEAVRTARAVCGLGVAWNIWQVGLQEDPSVVGGLFSAFYGGRQTAIAWKESGGEWVGRTGAQLSRDASDLLARLGPDSTGSLPDKLEALRTANRLFFDPDGGTILRAARWLFDSFSDRNSALSFVQATVAAEILLGEEAQSEGVGLTSLMANRCAYLVGETRKARGELRDLFRDIYGTRSRIVHRGHEELSVTERTHLFALQTLCGHIIRRETELLPEATSSSA
jgi:hypothetical protein